MGCIADITRIGAFGKMLILVSLLSACGKVTYRELPPKPQENLERDPEENSAKIHGVISQLTNLVFPSAIAAEEDVEQGNCPRECLEESQAGCAYLHSFDDLGALESASFCSGKLSSNGDGSYSYQFPFGDLENFQSRSGKSIMLKAYLPDGGYREKLFEIKSDDTEAEVNVDSFSLVESQILLKAKAGRY